MNSPLIQFGHSELTDTLRRVEADIVRQSLNQSCSLESRLRVSLFRNRIRLTLTELEQSPC